MKLKGHTKIELFNAKTGELEQCVEDNNMFTNALDNLVNANVGAMLPSNLSVANNNMIFPLYKWALGGLLLLPSTIQESANNIELPSIPTGIGAFGVTDANYDSIGMRGVYNTEESGPIENGYKHIWEFITGNSNGPIAAAALTSFYSVNRTVCRDFTNVQYADLEGIMTSLHAAICGVRDGKFIFINKVPTSTLSHPQFQIFMTNVVVTGVSKLDDISISTLANDASLLKYEVIGAFSLNDYTSLNLSYEGFSAYPYDDTHIILFYSQNNQAISYEFEKTANWVDVYIISTEDFTCQFIRTIDFPLSTLDSNNNVVVEDYCTQTHTSNKSTRLCWQMNGQTHRERFSENNEYGFYCKGKIVYFCSSTCDSAAAYPDPYDNNRYFNKMWLVSIDVLTGEVKVADTGLFNCWGHTTGSNFNIVTPHQVYIRQVGNSNLVLFRAPESTGTNAGCYWMLFNVLTGDIKQLYYNSSTSYDMSRTGASYCLYSYGSSEIRIWHCSSNNYTAGGFLFRVSRSWDTYLATINNLPTPITKTSDQTMKVTYTIMDAEEEKV